jgi:tetratricopeptide (TPR) repeat protein
VADPRRTPPSPRTLFLLGALLLGLAAAPAARAEDPAPTESEVVEAERALAEGRAAQAAEAFRRLRAAPDAERPAAQRRRIDRGLARALLATGEPYAALEPLEGLVGAGEAEDLVLYASALLAHVRARLDESGAAAPQVAPFLEDARRALARVPTSHASVAEATWLAGEVEYLDGRLEGAVERWTRAATAPVTDADRWYRERLAHALYRLGRHADAARVYEALGNLRGAAASWAAAKQGEQALAHYATLIERTPADESLVAEALAAARFTGQQARLESLLAGLKSDVPDERGAWALVRGSLWLQLGQPARARETLVAAKPGTSPKMLGRLCAEEAMALLRDPSGGESARRDAATALLEGWAADPGEPTLAAWMALMAEQDFRAAPRAWPDRRPLDRMLTLQRALAATASDDPVVLANGGNIARLAGDPDGAVAALEKAVLLSGGDPSTRNDLALAFLAADRVPEAEAAMRQALADDPATLSAAQNLARLVAARGTQGRQEARRLLLDAQARAQASGQPSVVYRALALKAWRDERRAARAPAR